MLAYSIDRNNDIDAGMAADSAEALMVGRMRLVLAVSVLLTAVIDSSDLHEVSSFAWLAFSGYVVYSTIFYILSQLDNHLSKSKLIHWGDVGWCTLIISFTGCNNSIFFPFFFFAILTASFRFGFEEGARVSIASAGLFIICNFVTTGSQEFSGTLLRATFLLAIGYMSAHWGESKVGSKRRLALLRDVSRLSNPRFGVDHTITSVMEKIQEFFNCSGCILVMPGNEPDTYSVRTMREGSTKRAISAGLIGAEAASLLMVFPLSHIVFFTGARCAGTAPRRQSLAYESGCERWTKYDAQANETLAELLDARSFISAPVSVRKGYGRIYAISRRSQFNKTDALFLSHIVAQAFPVIDSIELLDRLASEAALQERKKIACDLHDTTIQPYIGLKLGLSALRNKATADNPLIEDLDRLADMATKVIADLRRYAGTFRNQSGQAEPMFAMALRRQVDQVKEFYGINIALNMESNVNVNVNDRLAAEVLHLVREGLSNICKHTAAQHGCVVVRCEDDWLKILIQNEGAGTQHNDFMPQSICDRATALGGKAYVRQDADGSAEVHINIPI